MASFYTQDSGFSPARSILSAQLRTDSNVESHYLRELLLERQNFEPFMPIFLNCTRLLNQELLRISGRIFSLGLSNYRMLPFRGSSPVALPDMIRDMPGSSTWNGSGWNDMQIEVFQMLQGMPMNQQFALRSSSSALARKIMCMDIPVDRYPNFNFIGRLLGPRGNSLKRIEAATGCLIFIRGRGSIKDQAKEERLRGKPGHAHLNEPAACCN